MADALDQPFTNAEPEKPGFFKRLAQRGTALRNAILSYVPVGIISAGVMVGGASAIGATGMLGGVGEWIGSHMGASSLTAGAAKVATIVGIGTVINGLTGLYKHTSGNDAGDTAAAATMGAKVISAAGATPGLAMTHDVPGMDFAEENPNKALPFAPRGGQPNVMIG